MKKLTRILIAACLCGAVGCDTEIPTEEMLGIQEATSTQSSNVQCNGGITLTSTQVKIVGDIVNRLPGIEEKLNKPELQDKDFIFGSQDMVDLYRYVAQNEDKGIGGETYCACGTDVCDLGISCNELNGSYICAGQKGLEEGACSPIFVEQRYLAYLAITRLLPFLKELMTVRNLAKIVIYGIADRNSPFSEKTLEELQGMSPEELDNYKKVATEFQTWKVIRNLIVSDSVQNNLFKSTEYKKKLERLKKDKNDLVIPSNVIPDDIKPENYDILGSLVVLGAMAECMNEGSNNCPQTQWPDGQQYDPDWDKDKLYPVIFEIVGANKSSTDGVPGRIYTLIRRIAARLLLKAGEFDDLFEADAKLAKSSTIQLAGLTGDANSNEDEIANRIDTFLVHQTHYLLNANTNLDMLLEDARIKQIMMALFENPLSPTSTVKKECKENNCDKMWENNTLWNTKIKPESISNDDAALILNALKNMFTQSYGYYLASKDEEKLYEAHRQFFGQYMYDAMKSTERQKLFEMTFTQTNRCIDHILPSGQDIGINQYCLDPLFQNNVFTFPTLASLVVGSGDDEASTDAACALADGIIMDKDFELKNNDDSNLFSLLPEQVTEASSLLGLSNVTGITVKSIDIHLGDDTGSNPFTVNAIISFNGGKSIEQEIKSSGMWISHRCPLGASCTENNECGMCSNSSISHDYGKFREPQDIDGKYPLTHYSNAICEKGVLVQKTEDNSPQTTPES